MLYASTRSNRDAYTAQRVLKEKRCPEGGLFVPFRLPASEAISVCALAEKSLNQIISDVLNYFFNTHISSWDVDLCLGRNSVRLEQLNQRIVSLECWHNLAWDFSGMVNRLMGLICSNPDCEADLDWMEVAVRIAVLFGAFGELMRRDCISADQKVDISVAAGDFSAPMSAWYARYMGLPIGNIICSCNENGGLWDLIHHGYFRTDGVAVQTLTPSSDVIVPCGLERLIHACGGSREAMCYVDAVRRGGSYFPRDLIWKRIADGMFVSVVSGRRMEATIRSAYSTDRYLLSPYAALAYAGLQDYRSKTGETRFALVLSQRSPGLDSDVVSKALNLSEEEYSKYFNR